MPIVTKTSCSMKQTLGAAFAVTALCSSGPALAQGDAGCAVEAIRGKDHVVCQTRSVGGKDVTATFEGVSLTRQTRAARVCSEPTALLREAVLWMPDHSHGSSPTRLSFDADSCTTLSNVVFSMTGRWQIKLRFADNDRAIVEFEVY